MHANPHRGARLAKATSPAQTRKPSSYGRSSSYSKPVAQASQFSRSCCPPIKPLFNMAWGDNDETVPRQRKEERPTSLSEPLPREKLPKDLQKIVDREDDFFENLYEGEYVDC
jgi:hypothetical protein